MTMSRDGRAKEIAQFGVVGLGVMGQNLALNIERNGYPTVVWNREQEWTDKFVQKKAAGLQITGAKSIEDFVQLLDAPRRILMMVKAGDPVDSTIDLLKPHMGKADILIDGGNSYFKDTQRREKDLAAGNVRFFGMGISGGAMGALLGPSLMPGGKRQLYDEIQHVLEAIAAQLEDGSSVTYCGSDGAGHFVKMVHNGIEYGDMQLIAEAYHILRDVLGLESIEIADIFARWNEGVLDSYLIGITAKIFTVVDEDSGRPLVELILDKAEQKGTGRWASQTALDLGVPIPTIHAAIEARFISALKKERILVSQSMSGPNGNYEGDKQEMIAAIHDALYASKICSYAQGFALIQAGSAYYGWDINLAELARIWKGGCIIRARFLDEIKRAYRSHDSLTNLLMDRRLSTWVMEAQPRWRKAISEAQLLGLPVIAMSTSLAYFDSYRASNLPQNLTQAQRDFFGSHSYERADRPEDGLVHTDWTGLTGSR